MDSNSTLDPVERCCIGCKKGISMQWTMYECKCCCVIICPECVCAARVVTASLVKVDSTHASAKVGEIQQPLPVPLPGQFASEPVATRIVATASMVVKRKPVPGAVVSSASTDARVVLDKVPSSNPKNSQHPVLQESFATRSATRPSVVQGPQHQPVQASATIIPPEAQSVSQAPRLPIRPGLISHAQTQPTTQYRNISDPPTTQQRSQLQQVHTAPQPTASTAGAMRVPKQSTSQPRATHNQFFMLSTNRKSSVFSLAGAKKLSHNKWVRSGAKFGANLVLSAVAGDLASGLLNSNSNSNNDSNNDDTNTIDNGINVPDDDRNVNDVNDDSTSLLYDNTSVPGDNTDVPNDSSQTYSPSGTIPAYQDDTDDTVPDFTSIDPSPVYQSGYSGYQYDTTSNPPSPGGSDAMLDYNDAQQQLWNAQDGLQNAEYDQSVAEDDGGNSAIDMSNSYTADDEANANQDLNWGTDATDPM